MESNKLKYIKFDELENLPSSNRENYEFETELFRRELPKNSRVLQVGSMDGIRITRLLKVRPDLSMTGLEIVAELVDRARRNIQAADCDARCVLGDITNPPKSLETQFDFVLCLNNTLGFIPDYKTAIDEMRRLGAQVYISVFGEVFTDAHARSYFASIGITIHDIAGDQFITEDGIIRRFSQEEVSSWGGKIATSPLGYLVKF